MPPRLLPFMKRLVLVGYTKTAKPTVPNRRAARIRPGAWPFLKDIRRLDVVDLVAIFPNGNLFALPDADGFRHISKHLPHLLPTLQAKPRSDSFAPDNLIQYYATKFLGLAAQYIESTHIAMAKEQVMATLNFLFSAVTTRLGILLTGTDRSGRPTPRLSLVFLPTSLADLDLFTRMVWEHLLGAPFDDNSVMTYDKLASYERRSAANMEVMSHVDTIIAKAAMRQPDLRLPYLCPIPEDVGRATPEPGHPVWPKLAIGAEHGRLEWANPGDNLFSNRVYAPVLAYPRVSRVVGARIQVGETRTYLLPGGFDTLDFARDVCTLWDETRTVQNSVRLGASSKRKKSREGRGGKASILVKKPAQRRAIVAEYDKRRRDGQGKKLAGTNAGKWAYENSTKLGLRLERPLHYKTVINYAEGKTGA
jgi:hypothetical protein